MLRFRLVENILLEDIESVRKYYPNIDDETFDMILHTDPTYKEGSNSVGKYTKWLLNMTKNKNIYSMYNGGSLGFTADEFEHYGSLDILKDYLTKFDKLKTTLQNRDIGQFKSTIDFVKAVDGMSEDNLTDRQKERRLRKSYDEADLVYSDSQWEVWIPRTYAASCTLGKGTEWCTAYSKNDDYYRDYTSR